MREQEQRNDGVCRGRESGLGVLDREGLTVASDLDESVDGSNGTLNPSEWVDRYGDSLYRYAFSRLRDAESAEEVVQETFVAALGARRQYAGTGSEAAWLMGILKRKIIDHLRARNRERSGEEESERDLSELLFDETGNWRADVRQSRQQPDFALQRDEFWQTTRECLSMLPQRQADAFALREMEGLSSEEICKELEISASNLWVLLYRARLQLSNCMRSRWQAESVRF